MYYLKHYGFADENYLEHYGVKGMKWNKHLKGRGRMEELQSRMHRQKEEGGGIKALNPRYDTDEAHALINRYPNNFQLTSTYRHNLNRQSGSHDPRTNMHNGPTPQLRDPRRTNRSEYTSKRVNKSKNGRKLSSNSNSDSKKNNHTGDTYYGRPLNSQNNYREVIDKNKGEIARNYANWPHDPNDQPGYRYLLNRQQRAVNTRNRRSFKKRGH